MNARSQIFEFTSELCQVEEVSCSILHTLLFHRSTGKFRYQQQGSYTIGTVGFEGMSTVSILTAHMFVAQVMSYIEMYYPTHVSLEKF